MVIIFGIPRLARRVRLPAVVGLLLSGVVIGPHVLGIFGEQRPIAEFLAELGKLLLMFVSGLEIDLALFRQVQGRSIIFGLITTGSLSANTAVASCSAMDSITAIVVGSCSPRHPFLSPSPRSWAERLEPITVTVGATVLRHLSRSYSHLVST
jgi:Kef-type K+ transport system membrane component KefB